MNRQNVQRTIDYLRAIPNEPHLPRFHMSMWIEDGVDWYATVERLPDEFRCGTTACIAGHVVIGFREEVIQSQTIADAATEFLGLSYEESEHLFHDKFHRPLQDMSEITLDQAIAELERMLAA